MGLVFRTALFKNKQSSGTQARDSDRRSCESGQHKGETLSVEAMKLQILDEIIFLALPNRLEMCNWSTELRVHTKYIYTLQMRSSVFPADIYFI